MNKTIAVAVGLALALISRPQPGSESSPRKGTICGATYRPARPTSTPEMWFYQQERDRYENPRSAVRRNAEFRAAQRSDRLAAMKWYGQSNARPVVSPTPNCDTYGAGWVSNTANPYQWRGGGSPSVVVRPSTSLY